MAKSVSDYLRESKLNIQRGNENAAREIAKVYEANPDLVVKETPVPVYTQPAQAFEPINELPLQRRKTANMLGTDIKDTGLAVASGVTAAARGATAVVGTATTGYTNIIEAALNKPLTKPDDVVNFMTEVTGQDAARDYLTDSESDLTKLKRAEFSSIMSNKNVDEVDRAKQVADYYLKNPDMLLLDTAKVIPQSAIEMAAGSKLLGGLAKSRQLGTTAKVGVSAGLGVFGNSLAEVATDENNDIDGRSIAASVGKAALVGGLTAGASKLMPSNDIDRVLVGGGLDDFGKNGFFKGTVQSGLREIPEEFGGEGGEKVIDNWDKGNNLSEGALASAVHGGILGASSGTIMGAPMNISAGVDNVSNVVANRQDRKNGTLEENVDTTSDKYNPVRAYKDAAFQLGSSNIEERTRAENIIQEASKSVYAKADEYQAAIAAEKNLTKQTALIKEATEFSEKYIGPLQAEIRNNTNALKANKNIELNNISKQADALANDLEKLAIKKAENYDARVLVYQPTVATDETTENTSTPSSVASRLSAPEQKVWERSKAAIAQKPMFKTASEKHGVPLSVLTAIVAVESEGVFSAKSPTGALGLLQQTEIFRKEYGLNRGDSIGATDAAIDASADYLAKSYKEFGNWNDAILSYNAGRGGTRAFKNGNFKGSANRKAEVANYLGKVQKYLGETISSTRNTGTTVVPNSGDDFVSNDSLKGLKVKSSESIANGQVRGYTADFAKVTQNILGSGLRHFSSFNDDFHKNRGGKHPKGQAFDISLNGNVSTKRAQETVAQLEKAAAEQGFKIAILDEYTNPSKGSTGGHIHVSVLGRTTPTQSVEKKETAAVNYEEVYESPNIEFVGDTEEVTEEEIVVQEKQALLQEQTSKKAKALFSVLDADEIENSNLYSIEQKAALRKMLDIKQKLNENKKQDSVNREVYEGSKGKTVLESNLGIRQYEEVINQSISTGDTVTATKYLGMLDNFVNNHASKNEVIQTNIAKASPSKPLYVAADELNQWSVVDRTQYTDQEFEDAGGLRFFNDNPLSKAIAIEAKDLSEFREGINGITSTMIGTGVAPIASVESAEIDPLVTTPVDAAPTPTAAVPIEVENTAPNVVATTYKAADTKIPDAIYISDDTFGFNKKNQYGLNVATDGTLEANKANIDTILDSVAQKGVMFPETGVGAKLAANAPNTYKYLNEQLQSRLGVDNATTVVNAPRTVVPNRSAATGKGKVKGLASSPIEAQMGKIELSSDSIVGKKGYRNTYTGQADNGNNWSLNIVRDKTNNKINKVVLDTLDLDGNNNRQTLEFDPMISDGDIIDQIESDNKIAGVLQQANVSEGSTVNDAPELETVKGRTFPKEFRKGVKVEEAEQLFEHIEKETISDTERKIYTSMIKPIPNFNPNLKVRVSDTVKQSSYDEASNTIYVKSDTKGSNILQETTRMVIASATAKLATRLDNSTKEEVEGEGKAIVKLNRDISRIKRDINRLITLGGKEYLALPKNVKIRLLDAISTNAKLVSATISDPAIITFLRSVKVTEGKTKSSLFRKITNSLRTFFNIGNNENTATLFDRMLDISARTVELQARNSEISFKVSEQGKAGVFQDVIKEEVAIERDKPFWQRNQLLAGFNQLSVKAKPLSGIANLASKLKLDLMQGLGTLVSESPTKAQREQLVDFLNYRDEFSKHVLDTFAKKNKSAKTGADFNYQDMKGFLEHDGEIDENTITAIALATYNWAIEFGNKNLTPDKDIKKFLNLDPEESAYIPDEIRAQYQYLTGLKSYTTTSIGKKAAQALNIKATDFVRIEAQSAFESSLGEWALNAMQSANLVHLHSMSSEKHMDNIIAVDGDREVNSKGDTIQALSTNGIVTFVSISGFKGGAKNRRLEEIAFKNKNTLGYMGKVFGVEIGLRAPSLTPIDNVKTKIKRTRAITSSIQTKFMKKMQDAPISIDEDMHNVLSRMVSVDRDIALEMIGALVTDEALAKEHKDDRASKVSAAEGVLRDLENSDDFIGSLPRQADGKLSVFYDGVYGAKNNRMHYNSNMFNFQSSLLHRALGQYDNFKSEVNLDGLKEDVPNFFEADGQLSNLGLFFKAIAERAEGTEKVIEQALKDTKYSKGFTQDKIPGEVFLPVFHKYLTTDPLVAEAVAAMSVMLTKPKSVTKEQTAKIAELVKVWKGNAESLRGLVEYTKLTMAMSEGKTSIETHIGIHSDGVNNGIALANVSLGTATERFLSQVGMFVKGSKYGNFYDTRTDSELQDYYEGFGTVLVDTINSDWNKGRSTKNADGTPSTQLVLLSLNTSFFERANMKALLIPFGYSAGMKRIKALAYGQFLQDVKGTMKTLAQKDFNDPQVIAEHKLLQDSLSVLAGNKIDLPTGKELLEFWFDMKTINVIGVKYNNELGDVVAKSMKTYAAAFIKQRNLNVKLQNAASDVYLAARSKILEEAKEEYIESLVGNGMTKAIADKLYAAEGMPAKYYIDNVQSKLQALLPTLKTPYNHTSSSDEGSFVMLDENSQLRQSESDQSLGYKVDVNGNLVSAMSNLPIREETEEGVGVFGNSAQVQGMDAYIAGWTSAFGGDVNINVHDAGISGLSNFREMVNMQNKATFEGLRDYAMQTQSLKTLIDTLTSAAESMGPILYRETLATVVGDITGADLKDADIEIINDELRNIIEEVTESQASKIAIIRNLETVHQYAGEGAPYLTSEADNTLIDLAENKANELLSSMEVIYDFNESVASTDNVYKAHLKNFNVVPTPTKKISKQFSGITDMQNLFDSYIAEGGTTIGESRLALIKYVMSRVKSVNSNITLEWESEIKTPNGSTAYGVYMADRNVIKLSEAEFNRMSPADRITALTHELVHAVSAKTIRESKDKDTQAAIFQLKAMLTELRKVKQNVFTVSRELESVEELIAYGLTEPNFLVFIGENLKGTYKSPKGKASNGLVAFINAINAFFKRKNKVNNNVDTFIRLADAVSKKAITTGQAVNNYSTKKSSDVLKSLDTGSISNEFSEHLDGIIDSIITPNYESSAEAGKVTDDILNNVSKRALLAGFTLSDKELHVMEIVKAVGTTYLDKHSGSKTAANMNRIYDNILRQLKVDDFLSDPSSATMQEKAIARKKFDYITKNDSLNKKEHLERLYALSLASEEFRAILAKQDNNIKAEVHEGWYNKLMAIFADMVSWLTSKYMHTNGLSTPIELDVLFKNLANIDAKARANRTHMIDRVYEVVTSSVSTPANFVADKLVKAMFGTFNFAASRTTALSGLSSVFNAAAGLERTGVMNVLSTAVDNNAANGRGDGSNRLTGFGEILNELARTQGMKQTVEQLIRAVSKAGQSRNTVKTHAKSIILSYFKDNAENVSKELLNSITQVALRTDMSSLMNHGFSISRVITLLTNDAELNNEISKLEIKIAKVKNGNDMLMQTKALGLYMAREVATEHMVKNAENIAIGVGSWYQTSMVNMDIELRDNIDALASMYAVTMAGKDKRNNLKQLITQDPEGVKATLKAHRDMISRGKADFKDNPYNFSKGFVPQDTHHLRSLRFATSTEEIAQLKLQGWSEITPGDLGQDKQDKTSARTLMFHNDISYQDYVSGALDMKDTHAKGTIVYDEGELKELKRVEAAKLSERKKRAAREDYTAFNPLKASRNSMIANYASEGTLISYGYEMSAELRDTYLERNNNAVDLLGMYESNLTFKPEIEESQVALAQAIYKDFTAGYSNDPRKFVTLDPHSTDENIRVMYRMMPYAFKAEATKLFGEGNPIVVRSNVYNSVFGFKTYSMSEMFDKVTGEKNALENLITTVMNAIFADKAQMRMIQGERAWQYAVSQIKDFVVIRNINVLIGNIVSNSLLLALHGVPPIQQAKDFVSVWRNGGQYRKLAARVLEIDTEISINQNRPDKLRDLKREKTKAMKAMERNPMHEFMQAGLMSTIVEDVKVGKDDTAFKSDFEKKLEEIGDNLPRQVVEGFNWAVTNPGTPLHDFMAHSTQFSDLAAKYSLTNKLMRDGKSMADAIAVSQDNFINYDVPTSKGLDYANRIGLFMFTKFFIRFQQVLLSRLNEKAGSTIAQHIGVEYFTGLSGVMDPFALSRVGNNPFSAGPISYGDAFSSITTVDAISGIFN